MNASGKGSRNELRVKKYLEAQGYRVERRIRGRFTKDFFNLFDLICLGTNDIILAQVKTNKFDKRIEQKIREFKVPPNVQKVVYVVYDYRQEPDEIVITD